MEELSEKTDIDKFFLTKIENGDVRKLDTLWIYVIASKLEVAPEELLEDLFYHFFVTEM